MTLSSSLLKSTVVAALGGLLFGFDTVVISGAEQKIQSLWNLSPGLHGMAMAAVGGSSPSSQFGRQVFQEVD